MTSKERILAALARANGPVCDDCLSEKANVRPRQQVNGICNPMGQANVIVRQNDTCIVCHKLKLSSRTRSGANTTVPVVRHVPAGGGAPLPVREPPEGTRNNTATSERTWRWEGHVQDTLAAFLTTQGWRVTATANTASKEPGIDIVATKDGRWLAVEVKGYPSTTYEYGPKRGEAKPTSPYQARQWYSHALLSMMQLRHKRPDAEIAACFPDYPTYRRLLARTRSSFELLGFGVYFVGQDGTVMMELPHTAPCPERPRNARVSAVRVRSARGSVAM